MILVLGKDWITFLRLVIASSGVDVNVSGAILWLASVLWLETQLGELGQGANLPLLVPKPNNWMKVAIFTTIFVFS